MNLNMKIHSKKEECCQNLGLDLMNSLPRGSLRKHINVKSYSEENSKNIRKMTLYHDNVNYKKRSQIRFFLSPKFQMGIWKPLAPLQNLK